MDYSQLSIDQLIADLRAREDLQILETLMAMFGSAEAIENVAEYFKVEYSETAPKISEDFDGVLRCSMEVEWKLVPRSLAERIRIHADEIIEKNTRQICIVCAEPIDKVDLVPSIHGPYHVWCLDGHK